MLTELYILEAKSIQINKVPADRSLLPKDQEPKQTAELVSVSWVQAPNTVIMHPQVIKTTVHITKSPILQNTHICCRWLISRIIYDCLATVRLSQLMQIFCCHSCHIGITSVQTKSPPCRTQPCPKAVGLPRALTSSAKFNSRGYQNTKTIILFHLYCPAYESAGHYRGLLDRTLETIP